ncbi:MAG: hypothetical protein MHM6MM_005204 [Cercozoa sp. M6MM]
MDERRRREGRLVEEDMYEAEAESWVSSLWRFICCCRPRSREGVYRRREVSTSSDEATEGPLSRDSFAGDIVVVEFEEHGVLPGAARVLPVAHW